MSEEVILLRLIDAMPPLTSRVADQPILSRLAT